MPERRGENFFSASFICCLYVRRGRSRFTTSHFPSRDYFAFRLAALYSKSKQKISSWGVSADDDDDDLLQKATTTKGAEICLLWGRKK